MISRALLALVLVLAGCGGPSGTRFETVIAQQDGSYRMPVVLGDQTALVDAIEPATIDVNAGVDISYAKPVVVADPRDPSALLVVWGGGACDDETAISFGRAGEGFRLGLQIDDGLFSSCIAVLLGRAVRIRLSEPIDPASVTAVGAN